MNWTSCPIIGYTVGSVCSQSDDGYHHADSYVGNLTSGYYECICVHCGDAFKAYETDLQQSYDNYVADLPASGLTSDGKFLFNPLDYPDYVTVSVRSAGGTVLDPVACSEFPYTNAFARSTVSYSIVRDEYSHIRFVYSATESYNAYNLVMFYPVAPISGVYALVSEPTAAGYSINSSAVSIPIDEDTRIKILTSYKDSGSYFAGDALPSSDIRVVKGAYEAYIPSSIYADINFYPPVYEITPTDTTVMDTIYSSDTRVGALTGDYGIIGDNGTITQANGNYIVDETNNLVYNPVTNTTTNISNWSYDYSDRSYTVVTDSGNTQTITYGDEYITINEGDTIYNVYYLVPDASACQHTYTVTSTTEPTCGAAGSTLSTCSLCGGTKTDPIPATRAHAYGDATVVAATCTVPGSSTAACSVCGQTNRETLPAPGHTWIIKQTVQTQYDDTGNLIAEGYTIFECSVCGEQYKSTDGTVPPTGGSSGSTGDTGEEGGSIWDKLGTLLGTIGDGFISILAATVGKLLDGLIALAQVISEKGAQVVTLILSFFDQIPALFGAFPSFLGAVFPFIPEEMMLILEFGLAAAIFVGIWQMLKKR